MKKQYMKLNYKKIWKYMEKKIDYTILPKGITQEKMIKVLKRIIDTGESVMVGFNNIKDEI